MEHSNRHKFEDDDFEPVSRCDDDRKRPSCLEKDEPSRSKFCAWLICLILILALGLLFYVYTRIKDPLIKDIQLKKSQIESWLPQGQEEIKKSLDQGQALYDETKQNVDTAKETYDKAKDLYDKGQSAVEGVQDIYQKAEDLLQ